MTLVTVRVYEEVILGGGFDLAQGIHDINLNNLSAYQTPIQNGLMGFALNTKQTDLLAQEVNEQFYKLWINDKAIADSIPSVPLTTKGDILGYSTANVRVPVGANDTVLVADSAQARGLKWASLIASQIPSLDAAKITSGVFAQSRMISGGGTNNYVYYQSGGAFAQSQRFQFDGTDFSLVNATASTSGVPTQNSPYAYFKGTAWNGSSSIAMDSRISWKPSTHNKAKFSIEGNNQVGGWSDILAVESEYATTNSAVLYLRGLFSSWGGKIETDYEGTFRIKDLSGNLSNLGGLSFGLGHASGYNQFFANSYDAEIRTHFNGKIVLSAGRPSWKYGDNAGNTGSEFVQIDMKCGIGVGASPSAMLQIRKTSDQFWIEYDGSNKAKITVASDGATTFDALGSNAKFVFADNLEMSDGKDLIFGGTTGTKLGGSGAKIGLYNATPVAQQTAPPFITDSISASIITTFDSGNFAGSDTIDLAYFGDVVKSLLDGYTKIRTILNNLGVSA